ncbi:transposable element Tcb1 transposase [Trichonephila clavipes]|nr:transposable element Tcb1 transposase [Trichonephila clavipes]
MIVTYRECGLSLTDFAHRTDRNPTTVIWIWNQWVAKGHTELHAGSQHPPIIKARVDRHIARSSYESQFRVQYCDGRKRVWSLRRDHSSPACIQYWLRNPVPDLMYISGTLHPPVVPYPEGLPNVLYQQDNARLHFVSRGLTFLDTQDIRLLPWSACSRDFPPIENIWSRVAERLVHHFSPANSINYV